MIVCTSRGCFLMVLSTLDIVTAENYGIEGPGKNISGRLERNKNYQAFQSALEYTSIKLWTRGC